MKPQLHILSLPHTQLTHEYVSCAYTMKALKLAKMMNSIGYTVFLYGSEDFDLGDTDIQGITTITKAEQYKFFGDNDHTKQFYNITWNPSDGHWVHFNNNAIGEINKRVKPKDLILTFAGVCQQQVANAFPNHMTVEAGIGYTGTFSKFRVFESYAHMHWVYGNQKDDNGHFYDTVIPNYYDPDEFPFSNKREDYFLFIGRLIERKGLHIAQQVCEKLGKRLVVAGQGEFKGYGEYVGTVGVKERGELMSRATAVFVPTTYLEPFGGVHAEALLSGSPVITTNFGVFTETVEHGINGWRCDVFQDFIDGMEWAESLSKDQRLTIAVNARARFAMDFVKNQYDHYFNRLMDLYGDGWYTTK